MCLHTQCPEIGRQQTFLDSLHSSSVSKIQKSRAQKLQITFSGLIFSLSMSQKVYIPIKQKFPDGALFPLSGPSTVPQCVHTAKAKAVCLVSLTELSSIIWYDYFTILFWTRNVFESGFSHSTSCVTDYIIGVSQNTRTVTHLKRTKPSFCDTFHCQQAFGSQHQIRAT